MGSRSLMETARAVASKARLSGHLVSLPSEMHWIEDGGFKVREFRAGLFLSGRLG